MKNVLLTALVLMLTGCAWDYQSLGTGTAQLIVADRVLETGLPQAQIRLASLDPAEERALTQAEATYDTLADKWSDVADNPQFIAQNVTMLAADFSKVRDAYLVAREIAIAHQEEYAPMIWGNFETYDAGAQAIDGNFTRFIDSANSVDAHSTLMQYLSLAAQLGIIPI